MNAIELSKMIERYNSGVHSQIIVENYQLAAEMLRKQHEAIKMLREALADAAQSIAWKEFGECRGFTDPMPLPVVTAVAKAKHALKDTEGFQ